VEGETQLFSGPGRILQGRGVKKNCEGCGGGGVQNHEECLDAGRAEQQTQKRRIQSRKSLGKTRERTRQRAMSDEAHQEGTAPKPPPTNAAGDVRPSGFVGGKRISKRGAWYWRHADITKSGPPKKSSHLGFPGRGSGEKAKKERGGEEGKKGERGSERPTRTLPCTKKRGETKSGRNQMQRKKGPKRRWCR